MVMFWTITWVDVTLFLLAVLGVIYYYATLNMNFFDKKAISVRKPYPFVGNVMSLALGRKHINFIVQDVYNEFYNEKICGFFNFTIPLIIIKDPEIIKLITVKNFDHFTDHLPITDDKDPLFSNNLFALQGEKWHDMRTTLSPAFTSSKMREMLPFISVCSEQLVGYLKRECDVASERKGGKPYKELEIKDLMTKLSNDVIASCAFGLLSDSFNDPNNEFYAMTKMLTNISLKDAIKIMSTVMFPVLRKVLNIQLMNDKVENYYRSIVMDIIRQRNKSGFIRRDMIHLLMLAMKGTLHDESTSEKVNEDIGYSTVQEELKAKSVKRIWEDDELTAQAIIFLFAGYEPVSSVLSFICYELATNPNIQSKLQSEVDQYIEETGEMIKYNDIGKLTYLDMITSEVFRLWTPGGLMDRVCTKDFVIPPEINDNKTYTIQKGELVWIPTYSIHRDAKYFPNPDKFVPERFSSENKGSIKPESYMPFGAGPRSCIGNRFALMEIKIVMFHLIANFELVQTDKTDVPLQIKCHSFNLNSANGIWLGLKKRDKAH